MSNDKQKPNPRNEFKLADERTQERFGAALAAVCPRRALIFLNGDLGAGKTTLVRGFLRGLGYQGPVRSPTYTLVEPYELEHASVYHLDLYRLGDPEELEFLGVREQLGQEVIFLIEWPERGAGWLPDPDLILNIEYRDHGRVIQPQAGTEKGRKLLERLQF